MAAFKNSFLSASLVLFFVITSTYFGFCRCETLGSMNVLTGAYNWLTKKSKQMVASSVMSSQNGTRWEVHATTIDFAKKYGYPVETHTVTTEDGYLLTVHRIPGSPRAAASAVKTPVLLMHGIFCASDTWVLMGPEKGLGFLLADQGYDVWLGNARGNFYSRKHKTLSPDDPKFWNFTWHEMGVYDLPAVIDHILKTSNHQQLFYVGHSMGTTMFFVLTSMRPEYNAKIRLGVNMAPAVFLNKMERRTLKALVDRTAMLYWGLNTTGWKRDELFPRQESITTLIDASCRQGQLTQGVWLKIFCDATGESPERTNMTMLPIILAHVFSGCSLSSMIHFSQISQTDRFQLFDQSVKLGTTMPEYNLSKVVAPVSIHYTLGDTAVHPDGVLRLSKILPNVAQVVRVSDVRATHADFIFANEVKQLVYDDVIAVLKKHQQ